MTLVLVSLVMLCAAAALSLALARRPQASLSAALAGVAGAALLLVVASASVLIRAPAVSADTLFWPLPLGAVCLALDGLSAWFLLAIGCVAASVAVYSAPYLGAHAGHASFPAFGPLLCALLAAMVLVVCAADAVLFLLGWEAMTLTSFFLVAFDHARPEVRRGAWMYLVATHLGTALCVLPMFGVFTATAASTEFTAFSGAAGSWGPWTAVTVFVLGFLGFGTKAGIMPMHVWLPAAHPVAPTPVSAMLSGVVVKTGIYGLLRLLTWLPPLPAACCYLVLSFAMVSGVMGVLYALAQHDLKRLLAYHTVENIGIITLGISVGMLGQSTGHAALAALGYAGALLHVTNHALFKGLLFLSAGAVLHGTGTTDIERLGGLLKQTPVNGCMFLAGAVAICGLPPLNGFVSEWVIYGSLFGGAMHGVGQSGMALGVAALALIGGFALACFAKVFGVVFLGAPREAHQPAQATPLLMKLAMGGLALGCVFIGVLPGLWLPLAHHATLVLTGAPAETEVEPALQDLLAPAATLSAFAAVFALVTMALMMMKHLACPRAAAGQRSTGGLNTWGCAYARPAVRMQYSASSFAAPLIASFRALLWPERSFAAPSGIFPASIRLETLTPDLAEDGLFRPLFRGVARGFAMCRTLSWEGDGPARPARAEPPRRGPARTLVRAVVAELRRGSIQIRLAFIVVTLVVLFMIEALSTPSAARAAGVHHATPMNSLRLEP